MMTQIKNNSVSLTSLERKFDSTNESNERRFRSIEERLENPPPTLQIPNRDSDPRRAAFDKARRSMRVWPIKGDDQDEINAEFRDFAIEALLVPDTVVRNAGIVEVIRVRSSPHASIYLEVLVTFQDSQEHDFYFSKAKNLASFRDDEGNPTAGVRLDIAPYLMPTFKQLNDHGFDIRKVHGKETKRYIKYDEESLSLYLEIRLPGQNKWTRIRPDQARNFSEEKDRIEYQTIKRGLLNGASDNPNFVPLGPRAVTDSQQLPGPSSGGRSKWIPPARETVKPRTASQSH